MLPTIRETIRVRLTSDRQKFEKKRNCDFKRRFNRIVPAEDDAESQNRFDRPKKANTSNPLAIRMAATAMMMIIGRVPVPARGGGGGGGDCVGC